MTPLEIVKLWKIAKSEHGQAASVDQRDIPLGHVDPF